MTAGLLLIDKPAGLTSHDVVAAVRKRFGSKVGHAGTLDPMATGLMLVGVGAATRILQFLVGLDKSYEATVRLGWATDSDDATGERIEVQGSVLLPTLEQLDAGLQQLSGEQDQLPSRFSAKKVAGKRAYAMARAGEEFELKPSRVTISKLERTGELRRSADALDFDIRVDCSSGTYIRAIARDLGNALGCGGHLTALRRTRIGNFDIEEAQAPDSVSLIPLADSLRSLFTAVTLTDQQREDARHGRALGASWAAEIPTAIGVLAALDKQGAPVCILERNPKGWQPKIVFAEESA